MKNTTRKKLAATVAVSALGIGALGYTLRAAPGIKEAIAGLRTSTPPDGGAETARQPMATPVSAGTAATPVAARTLTDGTFSGRRQYAFYGYIRVQAVVQNGVLKDIKVLEYPSDNQRSRYINNVALPYLIQEAVNAQSYSVDLISGATFTSAAFVKSLQDALGQAGGA